MNEFIWNVLDELCSGLNLAALVLVPIALGIWLWHRKRGGPINWKRLIPLALLVCYTVVVVKVTLFRADLTLAPNTHLFRAWREAWNDFSVRSWGNLLLNIAMFMPLGVLLHLAFPKCRGIRTVLVMVAATVLLEGIQLFGSRGVFDVDDLFANILGGLMGWCLLMAVLAAWGKKWFAGTAWFLLAMIPVAAVGGIFAAYHAQTYGNLPLSCTYKVNTEKIEWVLACDLPEAPATAAVYKAPSMTQDECDAYAERMAEYWGGEYDDIYYYNEDFYYRDYDTNGRFYYLNIARLDGSFGLWVQEKEYDYLNSDEEVVWADLSRAETEELLANYGITIPEEAEFLGLIELYSGYTDDKSIVFSADKLPIEGGMLDGTCYVEVTEDGSRLDVNNQLVTYVYHADEPVISPEEALKLLQDGCFGNGWRYTGTLSGQYTIESCVFSFSLDTKGFYQPVYYFEVTSPDWYSTATILIPAIA